MVKTGDTYSIATSSGVSIEVLLPTRSVNLSGVENFPIQLTGHKLESKNYLERAQSIKLVVDGKGKLGYLTGEAKKPKQIHPAWWTWKAESSLATTWMISSIEALIGKTYLFLPTAKDVWDAIRETYSDLENSLQIFESKTKLW